MKVGIVSFAHPHSSAYVSILSAREDIEILTTDPGEFEDADRGRGAANAARLGVAYVTSYEEMLRWKPDAVVVCSENARHLDYVISAAGAGAHVLCEKPLAITPEDARAMVAACDQAGVTLMVALPIRFSPEFRLLQKSRSDGALGEVLGARGFNIGKNPIVSRKWFLNPDESGGGSLADLAIHVVDLLDGLSPDVRPVSVYAAANAHFQPDANPNQVETGAFLMVTYADGTIATIDSSWSQPDSAMNWGELGLQVIGTSATVDINPFASQIEGISDGSGGGFSLPYGENLSALMVEEFLTAIRTQREPETGGDLGIRLVDVLSAAAECVRSGQPVRL